MAEEIKNEVKDEQKDIDYIEVIQEMKKNTVDIDKYNEKVEENKRLVKALVEGEQLEKDNGLPKKKSAAEIRGELFGENCENLSNLDYWSKALDLREAVLEEGGEDIFLPYGQKIAPTADDVAAVDRVVTGVKSCIEYADGDSQIFTDELQRITVDNPAYIHRNSRK